MRFVSLTLARYGHFTDYQFNFGERRANDFHLIYGPNEAGKSTTLAAIVDLLFGMPSQSSYNFLHSYDNMEIDALLEQHGKQTLLKRYKRQLSNEHGQKIPNSDIDTHNLSRDEFRLRFSSDEESLAKGGEAILENNGDLGSALFSATSGVSDFSTALQQLMEPHNTFYRPRAKKTELNELKSRLSEIDKERKELDINAASWQQRLQSASEKKIQLQEHRQKTTALQKQLDTLLRQQQAIAFRKRVDDAKNSISELPDRPDVPDFWLGQARELSKNIHAVDGKLEQLNKQLLLLEKQKKELPEHSEVTTHLHTIQELESNQALYKQRSVTITSLSSKLVSLNKNRNELRRQIGLEHSKTVEPLSIPVSVQSAIEELLEAAPTAQLALNSAKQEYAQANETLSALNFDASCKTVEVDHIQNLVTLLRKKASYAQLSPIAKQQAVAEAELDTELARLNPWSGSIEQLLSCKMPAPSRLTTLAEEYNNAKQRATLLSSGVDSAQQELKELESAVLNNANGATPIDLQSGIAERDRCWNSHLLSIDDNAKPSTQQQTAREYALAQQQLDAAFSAAIKQAEQTGSAQHLESQRISQLARIRSTQEELKQTVDKLAEIQSSIGNIAESIGIDTDSNIAEITDWLNKREQCLNILNKRNQLDAELNTLEQELRADCDQLRALFSSVNLTAHGASSTDSANTLEMLLVQAEQYIEEQTAKNIQIDDSRKQFELLTSAVKQREEALGVAEQAHQAWQQHWSSALEKTWITERQPSQVQAIVNTLNALTLTQQQCTETETELNELTALQQEFERSAQHVIGALKQSKSIQINTSATFTEQLSQLIQASTKAQQSANEAKNIISQIAVIEEQITELNTQKAPIAKEIESMCVSCGVASIIELETCLESAAEKKHLQKQLHNAEMDLMHTLKASTKEEAHEQISDIEASELQLQIEELEVELNASKVKRDELHYSYRTLQDEIDNFHSDETVARLQQERQNIIVEMQAKAIDTMQARLGKLAIDEAVRQYRNENKSSMMKNAKAAFSQITCNHYTDLTTQPSAKKQGEDLVGINSAGQSKLASTMSSGTRAQLYLALRVAAHTDYAENREPLPFVADDIMEAFDDDRTAATLGVLAQMAQRGQVIYLTHHRHVVDMAKKTLQDRVQVHEITAKSSAVT